MNKEDIKDIVINNLEENIKINANILKKYKKLEKEKKMKKIKLELQLINKLIKLYKCNYHESTHTINEIMMIKIQLVR